MSTIGVPDTSALPLQSPDRSYDLRNSAAALTPEVSAPPGTTADLEQRSLQSFQNQPQFIPQDAQDFQQPQFQSQQDPNDPLELEKQRILSRIEGRAQDNANRGSRIRNMLTGFAQGMGNSMMMSAGLPTPQQEHERDLNSLIGITNAQTNQRMKDLDYQLKTERVPVLGPDGQPMRDAQGNVQLLPRWLAEVKQQHEYKMAERQPPKADLKEFYASSVQDDLTKGLSGPSQRTLDLRDAIQAEQKQAVGSDFEQFYHQQLRDKNQPDTAANRLAAKRQWTAREGAAAGASLGTKAEIVEGLRDGTLDIRQIPRNQRAFYMGEVKKVEPGWSMTTYQLRQKVQDKFASGKASDQITSLNTFSGHVEDASDLVDSLRNTRSPWLNRPMNAVAVGLGNDKIAPFQAAIEAAKDEYLSFLKAGHAPQQSELALADQLVNPNQSPAQLQAVLKQMATTVLIRAGSLQSEYRRTMGKDYPVLNGDAVRALGKLGFGKQAAGLSGGTAASSPTASSPTVGGPPAGATHTVPGRDGKNHYTNAQGTVDLGIAP